MGFKARFKSSIRAGSAGFSRQLWDLKYDQPFVNGLMRPGFSRQLWDLKEELKEIYIFNNPVLAANCGI